MARTRSRSRVGRRIVLVLIIFMLAVLFVQMMRLKDKNAEYDAQIAKLQSEIDAEEERQGKLVEYEIYVNSVQYEEDEAHAKLGMAYEDEIIFKEKR